MPECDTIVRGTLRYSGFPEFVKVLVDIGFLREDERDFLQGKEQLLWKDCLAKMLGSSSNKYDDLVWAISSKTQFKDNDVKTQVLQGLRWLEMFSDNPVEKRGNALDTLCGVLEKKMQYEEGERDLVVLQHRFDIEWQDGRKEVRTSTLVENGDPKGYSAMAKLVGVPCAVAVMQVLDGRLSRKGILAPMDPELNNPIMADLKEKHGIFLTEKII